MCSSVFKAIRAPLDLDRQVVKLGTCGLRKACSFLLGDLKEELYQVGGHPLLELSRFGNAARDLEARKRYAT